MRVAVLVAALLCGCAFQAGPGEHGWLRYEIWTQANLELELPFGSLCVGCLETTPGDAQDLEEAP